MVIHIAPVGKETEHVIQWLKEITPVEKVWLLHSKKGKFDFPKRALELEKKIKSFYDDCDVQKKIINDSFGLDDTMDLIDEIVKEEEENDPNIQRHEFKINVTGGTNAIAAAAIISATLLGAKAYYVKDKRMDPKAKKYVVELPIPPIGLAKMNKTNHKILKIIADGYLTIKRYDDKPGEKQGPGVITNRDVLKKMKWDKTIDSGKRVRKVGATNLRGIVIKLKTQGYINISKKVPYLKNIHVGKGEYKEGIVFNESEVMYEITPLGRRQAKNTVLIDKY